LLLEAITASLAVATEFPFECAGQTKRHAWPLKDIALPTVSCNFLDIAGMDGSKKAREHA
jgi:hypothetical protein